MLAYIWAAYRGCRDRGDCHQAPNAVVSRERTRRRPPTRWLPFAIPRWRAFRAVVLPQLAPYIAAAARSGLSLVWKIVLVAELLGRPNGVGFEIGTAFQLFDITHILAYALAFAAVVLAIETFLVQPFERHASLWRQRAA